MSLRCQAGSVWYRSRQRPGRIWPTLDLDERWQLGRLDYGDDPTMEAGQAGRQTRRHADDGRTNRRGRRPEVSSNGRLARQQCQYRLSDGRCRCHCLCSTGSLSAPVRLLEAEIGQAVQPDRAVNAGRARQGNDGRQGIPRLGPGGGGRACALVAGRRAHGCERVTQCWCGKRRKVREGRLQPVRARVRVCACALGWRARRSPRQLGPALARLTDWLSSQVHLATFCLVACLGASCVSAGRGRISRSCARMSLAGVSGVSAAFLR